MDIVDLSPHFERRKIAQSNFVQSGDDVIVTFPDGASITLNNIQIDDLSVGDLICTMDHGIQPVRWIGTRKVSGARIMEMPLFQPILIKRGAFGHGVPAQDIRVSP